jgi:hypothetical protein
MPTWTCQYKDAKNALLAVADVEQLAPQRFSVVVHFTGREDAETADMADTVEAAQRRGEAVVRRFHPEARAEGWVEE